MSDPRADAGRRLAGPRLPLLPILLISALAVSGGAPAGQVRPVYTLGAAGLSQALLRLQTTASALHTGAHPDDEDSAFIAATARGYHARVGYLSLNRGEGGQNIIGPELAEALGVIRTEELLQARRLDGGEQFFTRAIDYGFSKTRAEAAAKWNEREVLGDMVRVIRMFRPLVIYSRFSGTPADGHGHHQLAGHLTPLAFAAAADPTEFPEQLAEGLRPWQPRKLYRGVGFRPDPDNPPTIQVQTGMLDPVLGRTYSEIANEGRSQHKSQQMGVIETRGPRESGLLLVETVAPTSTQESSIFDGIDTTVPGVAALAGLPDGALRIELQAIADAAQLAIGKDSPLRPHAIVPVLATGLQATRAAREALRTLTAPETARADADFLLGFKERDFSDALVRAAQVVVDPLADSELLVAGESTTVRLRTFLPAESPVAVVSAVVEAPPDWTVTAAAEPPPDAGDNPFAAFFRETPSHASHFAVTVPADAAPTEPYFLTRAREGDRYRLPASAPAGLPFEPPLLRGVVTLDIGGVRVRVSEPVQYRVADGVRGELRRNPMVVPAVVVGLDSKLVIVPLEGGPHEQQMAVKATSLASHPVTGMLRLRLPAGWTATPAEAKFDLQSRGDQTSAAFVVRAPAAPPAGAFPITAEAVVGDTTFTRDLQVIAYPHIQTHRLYWPATATAQVLDLAVAPVTVGYIMGSGDQVPDALRRMGVQVVLIDEDRLATGDLSTFDTIVVGIRASEARPDFVANHGRLMTYVERGGTLIVQYQQNDYAGRNLPPFPAKMNTRVTDETAAVRILAPAHPAFTFPNRITPADFDGWVQERNLYAFTTFDERYVPLLETADPGEAPQNGGEVYADVGKGRYVYTAYAWFRQLPAGVPGAYRLFANLISLSKAPAP